MNWAEAYHREPRATWEDLAGAVRDAVTMDEAVRMYAPDPTPRMRRIPCPIHNGKDYNFSFTDRSFKCFVCGEHGDVIEFTRIVCGLASRKDAITRLNADFRLSLPLGREITPGEDEALQRRRKRLREREAEQQKLERDYDNALLEFTILDKIMMDLAPTDPESVTLNYIYAAKNIDEAWYHVQVAQAAIREFKSREVSRD